MKKAYTIPEITEIGSVRTLTAALGQSTRPDFNEFAQENGTGSFDVCDQNPGNNPPGDDFCVGS